MPYVYLVGAYGPISERVDRYLGRTGGWTWSKSSAYIFDSKEEAEAKAADLVLRNPARRMGRIRVVRYLD